MNRRLRTFLLLGGGICFGVGASWFVKSCQPAAAGEMMRHEKAEQSALDELKQMQNRRLEALEREVSEQGRARQQERSGALASAASDANAAATATPNASAAANAAAEEEAAGASADPEFDAQVAHEKALARWGESLARHEAEPVNAGWATPTANAFTADLQALATAEHGFELVGTQCRTTTCSARLRYPDFASARDGFAQLLHSSYSTACARTTVLPEPEPGQESRAYEVTVLYDCASDRAGG